MLLSVSIPCVLQQDIYTSTRWSLLVESIRRADHCGLRSPLLYTGGWGSRIWKYAINREEDKVYLQFGYYIPGLGSFLNTLTLIRGAHPQLRALYCA